MFWLRYNRLQGKRRNPTSKGQRRQTAELKVRTNVDTFGVSVPYLVGAAWGGRVGNLRFEPAVLPYVVKVEVVVQAVLGSKEGAQEISVLLEREEPRRNLLPAPGEFIARHLLSVEELSSEQDELVLLRVGTERSIEAGNTNQRDVSRKERPSALLARPPPPEPSA